MALKSFKTYLAEDNIQEAFPLIAAIPALLGKLGAMGGAAVAKLGAMGSAALASRTGGAIAQNVASSVASSAVDRMMAPTQPGQQSAGQSQEAPVIQNIQGGGSRQTGSPVASQAPAVRTDAIDVGSTNRSPLSGSLSDAVARGFPPSGGRNIRKIGIGY